MDEETEASIDAEIRARKRMWAWIQHHKNDPNPPVHWEWADPNGEFNATSEVVIYFASGSAQRGFTPAQMRISEDA